MSSQCHQKALLDLVTKYNLKMFGVVVINKDYDALISNGWLSDNVIDGVLLCQKLPATIVVPSLTFTHFFFSPTLGTKSFFDKKDFSVYEFIAGAVNVGNHWVAVIINLKTLEFSVLNPMEYDSYQHFLPIWQKYCETRHDSSSLTWTNKEIDHPLQRDSFNCGTLSIIFIEQVIQLGEVDSNLDTDYRNLSKFRAKFNQLLSTFHSD